MIDTLAEIVSRELELTEIRGEIDSEGEPLSVGLNLFVFVGDTETDIVLLANAVEVCVATYELEKDSNEDGVFVAKFEAVTEIVLLADCVPVKEFDTHDDTVFVTDEVIHATVVVVTEPSDVTVKSDDRVAVTDADELTVADELLLTVSVAVDITEAECV